MYNRTKAARATAMMTPWLQITLVLLTSQIILNVNCLKTQPLTQLRKTLPTLPRQFGTIKWYNGEKGYGVISPDDSPSEAIMFVRTGLTKYHAQNLHESDRVSYDLTIKFNGVKNAQNLKIEEPTKVTFSYSELTE